MIPMKKLLCALMCLLLVVPMVGLSDEAQTYEVKGFSPMKIAIAVADGKITSFDVVEHSETPGFGADVIEKGFGSLIGQDIQLAYFVVVSGATMTSDAINAAIALANGGVGEAPAPAKAGNDEEAAPEEFVFRNGIKFGMTKDEMTACEGREPDGKDDEYFLYSNLTSAGKKASIGYKFIDGKLEGIVIMFKETHVNDNLYIDDFDDIDASLTKKYGSHIFLREMDWKNDLYKDDKNDYGRAISYGHLRITSLWFLDNCNISHMLSGDNYSITHALGYFPKGGLKDSGPNTEGI